MAWYGLMRIHHPPWRFVSSRSRRTAPCSCLSPDFCPFPPLRFDALWRTVSFIPPEIPPLLGESISRLIHRRDKERVDKWKIFSFGGIFWEILFSGSRGLFISHDLKTSSGEIRFARKERKGCLLDDSRRDSLLKLRCCPPRIEDSWFSVGEDIRREYRSTADSSWPAYISPR